MSTEIAVRAATLPEKMQYAEALAYSGMLPEQYRKTPANVLWAIEYGETIGISAMAAITGVHLIEGKPTASSGLISGLVRRAGHRLRSGYDAATRTGWAEIVRFDDPEFTFRSEWNLDRAIEAELVEVGPNGQLIAKDSKGRSKPWKKFYPSMTKARAITEVARDACEEVLFGLHYTPEELGAETDDEGEFLVPGARRASRPARAEADPWQTPAPQAQPGAATSEADGIEDAEVVEDQPAHPAAAPQSAMPEPSPMVPSITPEQIREVGKLLFTKRSQNQTGWNQIISAMVRREITAASQLTKSEATVLIEQLAAEPDLAARNAAPAGPAPLGSPANPRITDPQMRMLIPLLKQAVGDDEDRGRELCGRIIGRPIASKKNDLSKADASQIINALTTGEIPPAAPAPAGVDPAEEGFGVFDALNQIILDVRDEKSFQEAQTAIDKEFGRGQISADARQTLRNRLAEQTGAVAA